MTRAAESTCVRAFFGLEVGEAVRQRALEIRESVCAQGELKGVHWVRAESIHLTLRFLGEIAETRTAELLERAGEVLDRVRPFEAVARMARYFPSARRPRVLILGVEPRAAFVGLARAVDEACVKAGFPSDERSFRPHVTLARLRGGPPPAIPALEGAAPAEFSVREVVLFRSQLGRGGSIYTPVGRNPLQGSARTQPQFQQEN